MVRATAVVAQSSSCVVSSASGLERPAVGGALRRGRAGRSLFSMEEAGSPVGAARVVVVGRGSEIRRARRADRDRGCQVVRRASRTEALSRGAVQQALTEKVSDLGGSRRVSPGMGDRPIMWGCTRRRRTAFLIWAAARREPLGRTGEASPGRLLQHQDDLACVHAGLGGGAPPRVKRRSLYGQSKKDLGSLFIRAG